MRKKPLICKILDEILRKNNINLQSQLKENYQFLYITIKNDGHTYATFEYDEDNNALICDTTLNLADPNFSTKFIQYIEISYKTKTPILSTKLKKKV